MVGVEEGRELRFRGDLYSQESTFPLVFLCSLRDRLRYSHSLEIGMIQFIPHFSIIIFLIVETFFRINHVINY